jgi:hypothetical protein
MSVVMPSIVMTSVVLMSLIIPHVIMPSAIICIVVTAECCGSLRLVAYLLDKGHKRLPSMTPYCVQFFSVIRKKWRQECVILTRTTPARREYARRFCVKRAINLFNSRIFAFLTVQRCVRRHSAQRQSV